MVSAAYPLLGGGVSAAAGLMPLPEGVNTPPSSPRSDDFSGVLTPDFIKSLHDQIGMAQNELRTFREQYRERQQLYAGEGHGNQGDEIESPLNVYNMAMRIYQRRLISGKPRANVRSRSPRGRAEAYELSLAMEQLFDEINLKGSIKEVVQQGLQTLGVLKVALTPRGMDDSIATHHNSDQPFADPILFENFVYDTNAKRWEERDFCGDRYRIPLADLLNHPMWNQDIVRQLGTAETRQDEDLKQNPHEESVTRLGMESSVGRDELRAYVTVWDIYLPRERLLITLPDDGKSMPIRVQRWDGPPNGPYHILCFDSVAGNIMGPSVGSHLEALARLLNRAICKIGDQLDRQKTITTMTPTAANAGDATTIQDTPDGGVAQVMDPKNTGSLRMGGVDENSYAVFLGLRDIFSWLSGNIDALGGLSSKAGTATQAEIETAGANGLIDELDDRLTDFLVGVMTDLAWYIYSDQWGVRTLTKKVVGTDVELPDRPWGPERRTRPFPTFEFEVDEFSIHNTPPKQRLKMILAEIIPTMVQAAQAKMAYAQVGVDLDTEALWRTVIRYTGLTELSELIRSNGEQITAAPASDNRLPGGSNIQGMPREYIRRNVGSGNNTPEGPGQQALAQMLSSPRTTGDSA